MRTAAFLLLAAVSTASAQYGSPSHPWVKHFDNLVTFGDSYTDENRLGYFLSHNGTAPPPGLLLPPSNATAGGGITWARWVSNYTGATLYDYAVSGGVCSNEIVYRLVAPTYPFPDVVYEVSAFQADVNYINASTGTNTLYTNRRADNTVYSMWIGTNDLGVNAFLTDSNLNNTALPDYVGCIFDRFDGIYATGGRHFVLMNNAPLELTPLYGMPGAGGLVTSHYWVDKPANTTEVSGKMREYTKTVNNLFDYRVPFELRIAKRYPGASIAIFDTNTLLRDIYNNPTGFGISSPANVTGQYYYCDPVSGSCTTNPDLGPDHFLWYDELHPSQQTDEAVAREFQNVVAGTSKYATYW